MNSYAMLEDGADGELEVGHRGQAWEACEGPPWEVGPGILSERVIAVSKQNRGKECTGGLVVEAHGHERHGFDDAEAVGKAPAEESGVTRGNEDAGSGEGIDRRNESLKVGVGFGGGVAEEGEVRCVGGDAAAALCDESPEPCWMACASSIPRSNPCTRWESALQAGRSAAVAGRTVQPGMLRSRVRPCMTASGSRTSKPSEA